jgi:hypothetical protein
MAKAKGQKAKWQKSPWSFCFLPLAFCHLPFCHLPLASRFLTAKIISPQSLAHNGPPCIFASLFLIRTGFRIFQTHFVPFPIAGIFRNTEGAWLIDGHFNRLSS